VITIQRSTELGSRRCFAPGPPPALDQGLCSDRAPERVITLTRSPPPVTSDSVVPVDRPRECGLRRRQALSPPVMARRSSRLARRRVLPKWSTNLGLRALGASKRQHPAAATTIPTAVAGVRQAHAWPPHVQLPVVFALPVPEPNQSEYLRLPLAGKSFFRVVVGDSCRGRPRPPYLCARPPIRACPRASRMTVAAVLPPPFVKSLSHGF
jgi:hypothetical protein